MKTYLPCIPCFVSQTLSAVTMTTPNDALRARILKRALEMLADIDMSWPPPKMAREIHAMIRAETGDPDPYAELKRIYNDKALKLLPVLEEKVESADDPFEAAVRVAIAGNIIDFGIAETNSEIALLDTVEEVFTRPLDPDGLKTFETAVIKAGNILYLADNAGEIVFDRPLIEKIGPDKITVVVKGGPVLNDAVMDDAAQAGLTDMVCVIDNGYDAPGTVLEALSKDFRDRFYAADVVISKGQGNYETLSHIERENLFFLLKVKCRIVAEHLSRSVGDIVLTQG